MGRAVVLRIEPPLASRPYGSPSLTPPTCTSLPPPRPTACSPSRAARACARLRPGGRLRPLTACAAPCRRRFRAIPPEQPEHDHVATVLFLVRCLADGTRRTGPLPAGDVRPDPGGRAPGHRAEDAAWCLVQF